MWINYSVVNVLMLCFTVRHMECLEGNKLVNVEFITKLLRRACEKGLVGYILGSKLH